MSPIEGGANFQMQEAAKTPEKTLPSKTELNQTLLSGVSFLEQNKNLIDPQIVTYGAKGGEYVPKAGYEKVSVPDRQTIVAHHNLIQEAIRHYRGAETALKTTGGEYNPETGQYSYKNPAANEDISGVLKPDYILAGLQEIIDRSDDPALKDQAEAQLAVFKNSLQISLPKETEPFSYDEWQARIAEKAKELSSDYDQLDPTVQWVKRLQAEEAIKLEKGLPSFTAYYQPETTTKPSKTEAPAKIPEELEEVNKACDTALDGQIEKALRAYCRNEGEENGREAYSLLFYRTMEPTPENARAVASLKLLRLQELGQTDLSLADEWKDQTVLRGHLADFIDGRLKQAGIEGLTQAEQKLLVESSLDINRLLTGFTPGQMQNVLEGGRVESITEGISDPNIKAAFKTLADKFAQPEVAALINDSLFAKFRPEEIIQEVRQTLGEELEKAKPGWLEKKGMALKNLPRALKDNKLMLLMFLIQGQGFFTGLLTQMLPEEGR